MALRRRAVFTAIMCLSGLACLEAGVRLVQKLCTPTPTTGSAAEESRPYVRHPYLGQIPRPGAAVKTDEAEVHFNSLGYRGPEFDPIKPVEMTRIACLGGSTTFDPRVTNDERTWPSQLQGLLRARHGLPRAEVVNAAVSGYSLSRSIIDLSLRTLDVHPDWVICAPGVNDIDFPSQNDCFAAGLEDCGDQRPNQHGWRRALSWSALYREIDDRLLQARRRRYGNLLGEPIERSDAPDPRALAAFERNLQTLVGICQAHGIRLALVTARTAYAPMQPLEEQYRLAQEDLMSHPSLSLLGHYRAYDEINHLIRRTAEQFDLVLIDQAQELPAGDMHFKDSVHFNDAGAAAMAFLAADRLAPALKREQAVAQALVVSQINQE